MKKRWMAMGMAAAMVMALTACGSSETAETTTAAAAEETTAAETSADTEAAAEETEAASGDAVVIRIGYENTDAEPIGQAMIHWQQLVEEQGDGSLKIELFPNSSLGTKTQLIDMMLLGGQVITSEQRLPFDITIPYNNRLLLEAFLTLPLERRIADQVHADLIHMLNAEIDKTGVSVTNYNETKSRMIKEKVYYLVNSALPF